MGKIINDHSIVLLNTGKIVGTGRTNYLGQGDTVGSYNYVNTLISVNQANGYDQTNVMSINSVYENTIILLNTGKILMFGMESEGEFANGSTSNTGNPIAPSIESWL